MHRATRFRGNNPRKADHGTSPPPAGPMGADTQKPAYGAMPYAGAHNRLEQSALLAAPTPSQETDHAKAQTQHAKIGGFGDGFNIGCRKATQPEPPTTGASSAIIEHQTVYVAGAQ